MGNLLKKPFKNSPCYFTIELTRRKVMKYLDREKIGTLFRDKRKQLELRLEEIADNNISTATISNIERAVPNVSIEKILYLGKKLGFKEEELPELLTNETDVMDNIQFELFLVEMKMQANPELALTELKKLYIDKNHPLSALYYYLMGRCYYRQKNFTKSQSNFLEAIHLANQLPHLKSLNIVSGSYYELSRIAYYKNDLQSALTYAQDGINNFYEEGERKYYKYFLIIGKSIYLEKLERIEESWKDIEILWSQINEIKNVEVELLLYEQRSKILKKFKMYEEAILCVQNGINMARTNKIFDRAFDLLTFLGTLYVETSQFDRGKNCFLTALTLKNLILKEYLFVSAYTQLGLLYMKLEQWENAQTSLEKAIKVGQKTNDILRFIKALSALGDCFYQQKMYSKAIVSYNKAIRLAEIHNFKVQIQNLHMVLAKCYEATNDPEKHREHVEGFFKIGIELKTGGAV